MILQKLASAVRRQDWFQVLIEVLIVIVGIFLGLQVQALYEDRNETVQERAYLAQLRAEIIDALPQAQFRFDQSENLRKKVHEVTYYVSGTMDDINLTEEHCNAISRSHNLVNYAPDLTSLEELVNSGSLANLGNERLKILITQYIRARAGDEMTALSRDRNARRLSTSYPGIIKVIGDIRPDDVVINTTESVSATNEYQCDYQAMKQNDGFKNDLNVNDIASIGYARRTHSQFQRLIQLLDELDQELGAESEEEKS